MHAAVTVGCQFRGRAADAGGSEVLDAFDDSGVEEFEAAFDEDLLSEGVADLHSRTLRGLRVVEGLRGEDRGSADAVATGAGTEEDDLIALA